MGVVASALSSANRVGDVPMKIVRQDDRVVITLSRRNLKDLLAQLLQEPLLDSGLVRRCEDGVLLQVRAERDRDHYHDRPAGPGFATATPS